MANKPKSIRSPRQYGSKDSPTVRTKFLNSLRKGASVSKSCEAAGITPRTAHDWRKKDPEFQLQWTEAMNEGIDLLEDTAFGRAVNGVRKPVYQGGELVGHVQEYSDQLLVLLLKGKRAGVYSQQHHSVSGPNKGPIQTVDLTKCSNEQLRVLETIFGPLASSEIGDGGDTGGAGET